MTCTFFGQSDCPQSVKPKLEAEIKRLIIDGVDTFYVGNNGNFDLYVQQVLQKCARTEPKIKFYIVLAYTPDKSTRFVVDFERTIVPEEAASAMPRYAISYRNKWLVAHADYVVTYITHKFGGAYQFASLAQRKNKNCINLA